MTISPSFLFLPSREQVQHFVEVAKKDVDVMNLF